MTDLLRGELGFTGVAVSDALDMGAVAKNFPPEKAIPQAFNAGCDQLIMPMDNEAAVGILVGAVRDKVVSEERLNEAVERILVMKEKRGILDAPLPDTLNIYDHLQVPAHQARAREIAVQSITLVTGEGENLPLDRNLHVCCINVSNVNNGRSAFREPESFADYLASDGRKVSSHSIRCDSQIDLRENSALWSAFQAADVVVMAIYINVRLYSGTIGLPEPVVSELAKLFHSTKPVIVCSFGSPYIINQLPQAKTYLCAYGATQPSQQAMSDVLQGKASPSGKLPVDLRNVTPV